MIRGLTTTWHRYSLALQFYYQMKVSGQVPDNFTYPFVFISCANVLALDCGRSAHSMVFKYGLDSDDHVAHSMITMYAKCGQLDCARKVFDEIPQRDLVSWNSMISGYAQMGSARKAMRLFLDMRDLGIDPNEMTLVSVLGACGDLGNVDLGRSVEEFVLDRKMVLNSYIGSALINMYGKCGDLVAARKVFDSMLKKDVVAWNAMITGYAQNGESDKTITLFNAMRETGALELGKWIETYALERNLQHDIYVASALIDMYAKCGNLDDSVRVFESMPYKNEVSWNSMISALAFNCRPQEALSLFRRMTRESGAPIPDEITFVAVLSACVHGGLVDEGRQLFEMMKPSFGVVPTIEHFSCMVDLLARAGLLHEAWEFIEKMPGKPDEIVLGALLAACRKKKNEDVSERVIKLLLEVEPSNSGNYVISSKIYADMRRWEESANVRVLMRERGVTKTPGCSWIELESQVHEFHAGDSLPDQSVHMYQLLNEQMRKEGYVPKPDSSSR
ncbi:Pentatricopeptide repeat-containing protein At2g34400 [Linum grandiflorum]